MKCRSTARGSCGGIRDRQHDIVVVCCVIETRDPRLIGRTGVRGWNKPGEYREKPHNE